MRGVYAVVLVIGVVALIGWMLAHGASRNADDDRFDPEQRWGVPGRRIVAGLVGFGMAGMSAEFAAREIPPVAVFVLAVVGAAAAAWWAGSALTEPDEAGDGPSGA